MQRYCNPREIPAFSDPYYARRNRFHFGPNTRLDTQIKVTAPPQLLAEPLTSSGHRIEFLLFSYVPAYKQLLKLMDQRSRAMLRETVRRLPELSILADILGRGEGDSCVSFYNKGGVTGNCNAKFFFAFHRGEANGRRNFKAMLANENIVGGFAPPYKTSDNGVRMELCGWRALLLSLIAVAFGLTVFKRPQHKLLAEGFCTGLVGIDSRAGAPLRHQTSGEFKDDRAELDRLLKVEKHQEGRRQQGYYTLHLNKMGSANGYARLGRYTANFLDADGHASKRYRNATLSQSNGPLLNALARKLKNAFDLQHIKIHAQRRQRPNHKKPYTMYISRADSVTLRGHLARFSYSTARDPRGISFWNIIYTDE
ncbi:hypothetical protein TrCOL_g2037 [Triparma columacea]|uniref:Uncharacterized protein n=1 Tax=Triparma columacea TaxID=722753 RepID=A0A9W7GMT2_9STRA|nr:hypothetical protein TrCOL_g2037 [Triparma columacea]